MYNIQIISVFDVNRILLICRVRSKQLFKYHFRIGLVYGNVRVEFVLLCLNIVLMFSQIHHKNTPFSSKYIDQDIQIELEYCMNSYTIRVRFMSTGQYAVKSE